HCSPRPPRAGRRSPPPGTASRCSAGSVSPPSTRCTGTCGARSSWTGCWAAPVSSCARRGVRCANAAARHGSPNSELDRRRTTDSVFLRRNILARSNGDSMHDDGGSDPGRCRHERSSVAIRTLHTALGVGSAMKEATRAGLDRAIPFGSKAPLRVRGVSRRWLAKAMGLPRGSITSVEVLDHHSGTAARARIAVESEAAEVPGHLFVKMVPSNYLQHVLMNLFRLGMKEIIAYRALGDTPPVRIP